MKGNTICGFGHLVELARSASFSMEGFNGEKKWIGVDFDGTLAQYFGTENIKNPGAPVKSMVQRVKEWLDEGITVKVFTARVCSLQSKEQIAEQRELIEAWCVTHIGRKLEVTCEKDFNMVELWDNRAVGVIENSGIPLRKP